MQGVCDCDTCLLNRTEGGILEIWYGTGNNGKTTLMVALEDKLGRESCIRVTPSMKLAKYMTDETKLVCIPECSENELATPPQFILSMKPSVRYVMVVNELQPWMHNDPKCKIIEFTHVFLK